MTDHDHKAPIEDTHPHLREFLAFLEELNRESERGAVLVAATMIDELLRRSILAFMIQHNAANKLLDGFNAPLGTFAARVKIAMCLGVISGTEYHDCELVRKIRNKFAHGVHTSFVNPPITSLCKEFRTSAKDYTSPELGEVKVDARGQFTTASVAVILNLTNRPHYAEKRRLEFSAWKY